MLSYCRVCASISNIASGTSLSALLASDASSSSSGGLGAKVEGPGISSIILGVVGMEWTRVGRVMVGGLLPVG